MRAVTNPNQITQPGWCCARLRQLFKTLIIYYEVVLMATMVGRAVAYSYIIIHIKNNT